MQKLVTYTVAVGCLLVVFSPVPAEKTGWKMPNLNPLAGKTQAPTSSRAAAPPTSGWKMPKLWPQAKAQPKRRANQPSTWNRVTSGTQDMLSKTADALAPWDNQDASKKSAAPKLTGSSSMFTQGTKSAAKSQGKDSGVSAASWWSAGKADEKPKTVTDFLSRPRP